jgi:hypothetical protein
MHSALEVPALLAIELQEGAGVLEDVGGRLHLDQKLRDSVLMPPLPAT